MIKSVLDTLEEAKRVQEGTAKKLADMIVIGSSGFEMLTTLGPILAKRLYQTDDVQVLYTRIAPNNVSDKHAHVSSDEIFVVTKGTIIYNKKDYFVGDSFTVKRGIQHRVGAGKNGGECITILIPPEKQFNCRGR